MLPSTRGDKVPMHYVRGQVAPQGLTSLHKIVMEDTCEAAHQGRSTEPFWPKAQCKTEEGDLGSRSPLRQRWVGELRWFSKKST